MPYSANVFSVFVASPSDVSDERAIVRQVLSDWNAVNARHQGIVFQTLGWEKDVYPAFGSGPQEEINRQILEEADILVGVFWTRIGTPTAEHPSGTVEEIKKHHEAGKPLMLYFSNQPVVMDSVDPEQYSKLQEFRSWCESQGIVERYESLSDFSIKLNRQIALLVNDHPYFQQYITNGQEQTGVPDQPEVRLEKELDENTKLLLKEASQDQSGSILKLNTLGGMKVQANGKTFGSEKRDPRIEAELEEAIAKLESLGLLKATNYKREVFRVTATGFRVAEIIDTAG